MRPTIVRRGLDLPLAGAPEQVIEASAQVTRVALQARDSVGLKPRLLVEVGQSVRLGQPLFEARDDASMRFVAPGSGVIQAVHRGERRLLQSVVIELDEGAAAPASFTAFSPTAGSSAEGVRALLLESGLWTALRTRPFGRVPAPKAEPPAAIFVTAIDTAPLAPDLDVVLEGREDELERGLTVLRTLTAGPVFLCRKQGSALGAGSSGATVAEFAGKHPAGTVGFHIHTLHPVRRGTSVWHLTAQDAARIGRLFRDGTLDVTQVVSLAGPLVKRPRLVRTRLGASLTQLVAAELTDGDRDARVISGSVLHGDRSAGEALDWLGRYHQQISVIAEGRERHFLGWLAPGVNRFSLLPTFVSALFPKKRFAFDTNTNGGRRAMVPIGAYERVMPMDLMATHLLRALTVGDLEWAESLGALELDEEDLALCTYVCPGKYEYGPALRRVLDAIEAEG